MRSGVRQSRAPRRRTALSSMTMARQAIRPTTRSSTVNALAGYYYLHGKAIE